MGRESLPEVELYSIGPNEADRAAPLLTGEAVERLRSGEALGMALVEEGEARAAVCARLLPENETHLELVSLYTVPQYRRRGLAGTLFMELLEELMAEMDGMLEYVTATFDASAEGAEPFFRTIGFEIDEETALADWKMPLAELAGNPLLRRRVSVPAGMYLRTIEKVEDLDLRRLSETLKQNDIADLTVPQMRQALTQASYILFNKDYEPVACAIVSAQDEKHIYLSQFFTANGNTTGGMVVLQAAAYALLDCMPGDVVLEIPTITDSSAGLVKRLIPSSQAAHVYRAVLNLAKTE